MGAAAMLLAMVIGLTAGTLSGLRPRSWVDASGQVLAMIGISVPSFVIGAGLLIVFAAKLRWLPVGGWGSLSQLALPAIALSLPFAATIARMVRVGMIEQMHSDHARTARAKDGHLQRPPMPAAACCAWGGAGRGACVNIDHLNQPAAR